MQDRDVHPPIACARIVTDVGSPGIRYACGVSVPAQPQPIIVCPLRFERDALMKRPLLASRCRIICCGPGMQGINSWADSAAPDAAPVILAGLAGALSDQFPRSVACIIDVVIDSPTNERWRPSCQLPEIPGVLRASMTSVDNVVADARAKRALHASSGATLVDLESVAFARRAAMQRRPWAIVRGISDAAADEVPADIGGWIDRSGRPRILAIAGSILRRPMTARRLIELRGSATQAMQAVARALEAWLGLE